MSEYRITTTNNQYSISYEGVDYAVSLARVGSQGSQGNSITNITLDSSTDELIFEITDSAGQTTEINAGSLSASLELADLSDTEVTSIADGQILIYQASDQTYRPHTLTTTSLTDVDNTGKTDGAVFVYDGASSKYKATTRVQNQNTEVIGGTF